MQEQKDDVNREMEIWRKNQERHARGQNARNEEAFAGMMSRLCVLREESLSLRTQQHKLSKLRSKDKKQNKTKKREEES